MNEKWSQKYKRSIDCNNPKGFSQKAHCQGRKKNEMNIEEKLNLFLEKNCPTDPGKWSASKAAAKSKFDVYPSAYANGWAAKNYKKKGGGWKTCKESVELNEACWEGYKQVGGKMKNGKMVPNCVPNNKSIKESAFVKGKTYGGTKCEGGCYMGKPGLMKLIKISKDNPDSVFMFRDDNYSGIQPHFIKNGVIAKATTVNPSYDLQKSKVKNLKIGKDVILSVRLFESVNETEMKLKKENHMPNHPERRDSDDEINYGKVEPLEYDVDNYDDHIDFIAFMREYTQQLNEATCPCMFEAEYQGRTVKLGKPMQGDVKKFKVYVKNGQGNVVKVNFGDPNMRIKKSNPERRKSFRARHNCDNPGPRWKARYWSCRKW
jgi:hypothetical protein